MTELLPKLRRSCAHVSTHLKGTYHMTLSTCAVLGPVVGPEVCVGPSQAIARVAVGTFRALAIHWPIATLPTHPARSIASHYQLVLKFDLGVHRWLTSMLHNIKLGQTRRSIPGIHMCSRDFRDRKPCLLADQPDAGTW